MAKISTALLMLLIANCYCYTSAVPVLNIAPGVFSKKTESNGLYLPITNTFQPITTLTNIVNIRLHYLVKSQIFTASC